MSQKATILDYALQIARAGVAGALAIAVGTAPDAAASIGFYADTTGAAEKLAMVVGGQTGPVYTRSGSSVNAVYNGTISAGAITSSALTNGGVCIIGASGLLAYDAGLTYVAASDLLIINHNAAAAPAAPTGTQLQVLGVDATSGVITIETGAAQASFLGRRANTSIGSPSGLVSGDIIVQMAAQGYMATGYATSSRATVRAAATETWSDSANGTRLEFLTTVAGGTTTAVKLTIGGGLATFATGCPVTIADTTASTTTAGALLIGTGTAATSVTFGGGNGNVGGTLTVAGQLAVSSNILQSGAFLVGSSGTRTTAIPTGIVGFCRSGGTIGTAGDMVLQPDLGVTNAAFVFRGGPTTPITVATISGSGVGAAVPGLALVGTSTITGGVTDGYNGSIRMTPTYDAATALTVTRHNYIDILNPALTGVGPAALTNACVFRYDAGVGTHKALDAATTKTTPGGVDGWEKKNVNGTIMFSPLYLSKTA